MFNNNRRIKELEQQIEETQRYKEEYRKEVCELKDLTDSLRKEIYELKMTINSLTILNKKRIPELKLTMIKHNAIFGYMEQGRLYLRTLIEVNDKYGLLNDSGKEFNRMGLVSKQAAFDYMKHNKYIYLK